MKRNFYFLFVALLMITMPNVYAQESVPEGAIKLDQPGTVSSYWIDTPGNYYCKNSIETQYKLGGGTLQNPIRIYIDGTVNCNQGQTVLGSGPAFYLYGGCVEFIGINGGTLINSMSNTIYCGDKNDDDLDKEIPNTNGKRYINYVNNVSITLRNLTIDRKSNVLNNYNTLFLGSHANFTGTYILDNVTIHNFKNDESFTGGSVAITDNVICTMNNCTFDYNNMNPDDAKYNGGVYVEEGTAILNNCTFTRNFGHMGGAVRIGEKGNVTLDDCTISTSTGWNNSVTGAVYLANGGSLTLKGNTTITTQTKGGNIYLATGAKFTVDDDFTGTVGVTAQDRPKAATPTRQITTNGSPEVGTITSDNNNLLVDYVSGATPYHQLLVPTIGQDMDNTEMIKYLNGHTNVSINLDRTIQTGGYNTICLPFAVSASKLKSTFGEDVVLKELASSTYENEVLTLHLEDATSIVAGKPYLIYVSTTKSLTPGFDGVTWMSFSGTEPTLTRTETTYCDFVPVFNPTELENDNKNILFLIGNNQLRWPDGNKYTAPMRGLRAYFVVKDPAAQEARTFVLSFDDQTTAIVSLRQDSKELDTNAPMYDLLGQQVSSSYRGIVIQNGKKFVVK